MGLSEEAPDIGCLGYIPLHGDCFAAIFHDLRNDAVGALFARGVVDHYGRAFRRQALGNTRTDALRSTCDDCDFVLQFAHVYSPAGLKMNHISMVV